MPVRSKVFCVMKMEATSFLDSLREELLDPGEYVDLSGISAQLSSFETAIAQLEDAWQKNDYDRFRHSSEASRLVEILLGSPIPLCWLPSPSSRSSRVKWDSCCWSIVMVEAAQDWDGDDGRCCGRCPHMPYRLGDRLPDALMGPRRVEVRAVRPEHPA